MTHRTGPALGLVLLAFITAACGGTASPSPAATQGPTPTPAAVPTTEPTTEPTAAAGTNEPTGTGVDLGAAAAALEGIDSYRLSMVVEGTADATIDAVVVRRPQLAQEFTITTGDASQRLIVIGDQAWLDVGTGSYTAVSGQMAETMTTAFDPAILIGSFNSPLVRLGLETVGDETRNGVETTHYRLGADSAAGQLASLPPGSEMDIWLADAGYLVSFEARNLDPNASLVKMDVTNINDPANIVEAPG